MLIICLTRKGDLIGKAKILVFLDELSTQVTNKITYIKRMKVVKTTTQRQLDEYQKVLSLIIDARGQVNKYAKETTVENTDKYAEEFGITLVYATEDYTNPDPTLEKKFMTRAKVRLIS